MNGQPRRQQPIAEALQWVSRITTVALMVLLPILGGRKLDEMRGTGYWSSVGLVFGLLIGAWQLRGIVVDAQRLESKRSPATRPPSTPPQSITPRDDGSSLKPSDPNQERSEE